MIDIIKINMVVLLWISLIFNVQALGPNSFGTMCARRALWCWLCQRLFTLNENELQLPERLEWFQRQFAVFQIERHGVSMFFPTFWHVWPDDWFNDCQVCCNKSVATVWCAVDLVVEACFVPCVLTCCIKLDCQQQQPQIAFFYMVNMAYGCIWWL